MKPSTQTTTFTHDNMGRIVTQTDDVGTISFGYDKGDNPLTITEGTAVLTRTFDDMGRVTSYTDASGNNVEYEWDKNGRLTKLTYPDTREVLYTYDRHNRLKTVTDWANRVTTYHWDAVGRLIGIDRPNGTTRTNEYTLGDELERYYERNGAGILQAYARFGYDLDSRIDWRYRLPKPQEMELPTFTATHDADNRVATWNSEAVTHDNDGNMTFGPLPGEEDFVNYSFDARNRLTGVGSVTYQYDSENNRIAKTTADGTTTYVFDPHGDALPRVLVRERPDESLTFYVYGIGLLYEVDESDNATYYHFDQSGSTIALTNDSGEVTDRIEYTPYGTVSHRTGTTDTPFLYVGQFGIQADENGLLHMRARYYSPELKRFINADPAGFDGGLNWYAYGNNSPLMYVDPDGEIAIVAAVAIGFAFGAALDMAVQMGVEGRSWSEVNLWRTLGAGAIGSVGGGSIAAVRTLGMAGIRQYSMTALAKTQFNMGASALIARSASQRVAAHVMSRPIYTSTVRNANRIFLAEAVFVDFRRSAISGNPAIPGATGFRDFLPSNPYTVPANALGFGVHHLGNTISKFSGNQSMSSLPRTNYNSFNTPLSPSFK